MKVRASVSIGKYNRCQCFSCKVFCSGGNQVSVGDERLDPGGAYMILCPGCYGVLRSAITKHHEITEPQGGRYTETTREVECGD